MRLATLCLIAISLGFAGLTAPLQAQISPEPYEISRTEVLEVTDEASGRTYQLYVRRPPGYNPERSEPYPVIYLNDGPYTFMVASGASHLPMVTRQMEHAFIVGLSFAQGENGVASRVRDLTQSVNPSWSNITGGAPEYLDFFKRDVFSAIESRYHVDPDRRILSGQSLGGSFGAWVLLTEPDLFSGYILSSPSLWYDDKMIFELEASYAEAHADLSAQVYTATGDLERPGLSTREDLAGDQERFIAALESRTYPSLELRGEIIEGGRHETTFPQAFMRGLDWMLGPQDDTRTP